MSASETDEFAPLIEAVAARQDRAAFGKIYAHFAPRLKAFAMRGGLTDQEAEEAVQESMVIIWRKASYFDRNKASAATWIFTIVRNKRIDLLRKERRPDLKAEDFAHMETEAEGPDVDMFKAQRSATISQRVAALPAEQLQVIQKAFFEDKSHREVAEELELPLGTVKSRIRLALERLRGNLEKE